MKQFLYLLIGTAVSFLLLTTALMAIVYFVPE